jgi:cell division protein FtsX
VSLSYTVSESLSGFTRTKLSSLLSIITISISVLLLGLFGVLSLHAVRFLEELRARVELEAFLEEPLTRGEVDSLRTAVAGFDGVEQVTFVSKSEAAAIFRKEFGEGILDVFDFNPPPPPPLMTHHRRVTAGGQSPPALPEDHTAGRVPDGRPCPPARRTDHGTAEGGER